MLTSILELVLGSVHVSVSLLQVLANLLSGWLGVVRGVRDGPAVVLAESRKTVCNQACVQLVCQYVHVRLSVVHERSRNVCAVWQAGFDRVVCFAQII
jgi:hypothetical protein